MPFVRLNARSVPLPFAACLLLAACASTGNPNARPAADNAMTAPATGATTARTTPTEFNGPQIVFEPESSELPDSATALLDDIAAKLRADPQTNVMLVGHTEDIGSSEMSIAISGRCVRTVSLALIKRGARPTQIRTLARGNDNGLRTARKAVSHVDIVMIDSSSL